MLLVSHPSLPVATFAEFVDYARKNPARSMSATLAADPAHITMELLMLRLRFQVTNVPRGAIPALQDLVAGQARPLDNYAVRRSSSPSAS